MVHLARMFYNPELVSQPNRERLENILTDRLVNFDLVGNEIDPDELTEEGSCADLFRRHTADLISSDLQFHIKGRGDFFLENPIQGGIVIRYLEGYAYKSPKGSGYKVQWCF